jgi:hypothetical protein
MFLVTGSKYMGFWCPGKIVLRGDVLGAVAAAAADAATKGILTAELDGEGAVVTDLSGSRDTEEARWVVWPTAGGYDLPAAIAVQRIVKRGPRLQYTWPVP